MAFSAQHRSWVCTLLPCLVGCVWLLLSLPPKWEILVTVPTGQVNTVCGVRMPCGIACVSATVTNSLHPTVEPQLEGSGIYTSHLPAPPSRVRKQVVNIPSFIVRLDSQKHIDFSLRSPYGGGRPGRVKRKNAKKGQGGAGAGDDEEED